MLLVAVAAVRLSSRSGLPSLLIYLGIGIAMGQDGFGHVSFSNAELTQVIGYAALVVILAEGGLGTKWKEIRPALPAAAALSLVGVAVSVGVTAAGAHYLVGLDWRPALIIGAVVSSTDAAAVFSVLRKVPLPKRITGVLEAESGFNDAPVVILVVAFSTAGPVEHWYVLLGEIALELAIGAAIGLTVGWLGAFGMRRVALPASGLYPIAVMAIAVAAYAAGALAHGSGFLAVYLAAVILGNAKLPHFPATHGFAEGLGWIAQIGMFVLLGLLVTPHDLLNDALPAVIIGLVLTMVARPLEVVVSLMPFRMPWQEKALMSWAGLRGAVPIILATIPMVNGVEDSTRIFNIVFVLVVVYTLIQGPTLPWLARKLNLGDQAGAADLGIESAPLEHLRGHLLSVAVTAGSRLSGVEISELRLPTGSAVTLVVRDGDSFVPLPTTLLRSGDELLVVATDRVRDTAEARLRAVDQGGKLAGWLGTPDTEPVGAVAGAGAGAVSRGARSGGRGPGAAGAKAKSGAGAGLRRLLLGGPGGTGDPTKRGAKNGDGTTGRTGGTNGLGRSNATAGAANGVGGSGGISGAGGVSGSEGTPGEATDPSGTPGASDASGTSGTSGSAGGRRS
ncbi:potassium/proton antiporter [Streptomyces sp. NPDC058045]|uniref:potassium/proton antiporter n=1 Tax=Streptomyces sp. NPDC058045 TaxID=3346311 RepID=UPI0036EEBD1C